MCVSLPLLAYLAYAVHGEKVKKRRNKQVQVDLEESLADRLAGATNPLQALALFFLAVNPAAGWQFIWHRQVFPLNQADKHLRSCPGYDTATFGDRGLYAKLLANRGCISCSAVSAESSLIQWVRSEGGFVGNIKVETRDGLRGLFASKDVNAGERLLAIPKACVISAEEDPQWGLQLRELLTARLVGALTRGENVPYIECLPSQEPLLCDWTDTELQLLQSPHMFDVAAGMLPFLNQSCAKILPFVKADLPTVAWAERMVRSRALLFESGWQFEREMCLVPLLDVANHRTPPRDCVEPVCLVPDEQLIVLTARTKLRAGDEVYISYREQGNEILLRDYGFAELLTPEQICSERLYLDSLEPGYPLLLGSDEFDARALETLRLQLMKRKKDSNVTKHSAIDRQVAEALLYACEAELGRMPTTEEEDRQHLADIELTPPPSGVKIGRWRSALIFRIGQKSQLARTVQALSDLLSGDSLPSAQEVCNALRALRV